MSTRLGNLGTGHNLDVQGLGSVHMITLEERRMCLQLLKNSLFSSTMILNLINDLLDLAKIENSQFNLNNALFNMHDVISKAIETLDF